MSIMSRPVWRTLKNVSRTSNSLLKARYSTNPTPPKSNIGRWLTTIATGSVVFAGTLYADRQGYLPAFLADLPTTKRRYANPRELQQAIQELENAFPGKVQTNADALLTYGHSPHSYYPGASHSIIVSPRSTEDVVKVVNISRKYKVPIVPYGSATSLEGHYAGVSPPLQF
jgi:D-lactate dehydrogenase (cytochrome)